MRLMMLGLVACAFATGLSLVLGCSAPATQLRETQLACSKVPETLSYLQQAERKITDRKERQVRRLEAVDWTMVMVVRAMLKEEGGRHGKARSIARFEGSALGSFQDYVRSRVVSFRLYAQGEAARTHRPAKVEVGYLQAYLDQLHEIQGWKRSLEASCSEIGSISLARND